MTFTVLITGSREIKHRETIAAVLKQTWIDAGRVPLHLIAGGARGADRMAAAIARQNPGRLTVEEHYANWHPNGRDKPKDNYAGFTRNQLMVDLGPDICLAFLKRGERNSGTRDCIRRAKKAGIPVIETWED
ncbi:SLOG family protein [Agromyces humi]|uniref:SLOG family protein n=1 Tax=Agromyces humi TaxID=1766800 RepID=UPI00193A7437|nr:SLOG family protein [Agromyces humi]